MSKRVNWFVLEEEHSIGFATIDGKDVFITEEAVRFDAPRVTMHGSLQEAFEWVWGDTDTLDDEELEVFGNDFREAEEAYEATKKSVLLHEFLRTMDEFFMNYKKNGIMESYRYDSNTVTMWISKEDYDKDHGYIWSALDGAIALWNMQNKPYYISDDEYAPDENGMIKYEFEIHCEDDEEV